MSGSGAKSKFSEEVAYFFGGDKKGYQFVQSMYDGTNYSSNGVSKEEFPKSIFKQCVIAKNFKDAKTYEDLKKGDAIHHEVTAFLAHAAEFHRTIDAPYGTTDIKCDAPWTPTPIAEVSPSKQQAILANEKQTLLDKLNSLDAAGAITSSQLIALRNEVKTAATKADLKTLNTDINTLVGPAVKEAKRANLVRELTALKDQKAALDEKLTAANTALANANTTFGTANTNLTNAKNALVTEKAKVTDAALALLADDTARGAALLAVNAAKPGLENEIKRTEGEFDRATDTKNRATEAERQAQEAVNTIDNKIREKQDQINNALAGGAMRGGAIPTDAQSKALYENIYLKWGSLTPDARSFYSQQLMIMSTTGEIPPEQVASYSQADLRFNLKKAGGLGSMLDVASPNVRDEGKRFDIRRMRTVFWQGLPDMAEQEFGYIDTSGSLQFQKTTMRKLYYDIYTGGASLGATIAINPAERIVYCNTKPADLTKDFSWNDQTLIKSIVELEQTSGVAEEKKKEEDPAAKHSPLDYYNFPGIITDSVTGYEWEYVEDPVVPAKGGGRGGMRGGGSWVAKSKDAEDAKKGARCSGTGIKSDLCSEFVRLISKGDPVHLANFAKDFLDQDLFDRAVVDAKTTSPDMIVQVLKAFGVQAVYRVDKDGQKFKVLQTFDQWVASLKEMDKGGRDISSVLLKNGQMLSYIRGLMSVCNANPNIINRKYKKSTTKVAGTDTYPAHAGLKLYRTLGKGPEAFKQLANELRFSQTPAVSSNEFLANLLRGNISGAVYLPRAPSVPSLMLAGRQYGGATPKYSDGSANVFKQTLDRLVARLREIGIVLSEDDKKRLDATIAKMDDLEEKAVQTYKIMFKLIELARIYGVTVTRSDDQTYELLELKDVRTQEDINAFINTYVNKLSNNLSSNLSVQDMIAREFLKRLLPGYAEKCAQSSAPAQPHIPTTRSTANPRYVPLTDSEVRR